jgi:hypothetical protein
MLASPAAGQTNCGKRSDIVEFLAMKHAEQPRAVGLTASNWLMELFTSKKGDTWTLVVTNDVGVSCIKGSGRNWRPIKFKPEGTAL